MAASGALQKTPSVTHTATLDALAGRAAPNSSHSGAPPVDKTEHQPSDPNKARNSQAPTPEQPKAQTQSATPKGPSRLSSVLQSLKQSAASFKTWANANRGKAAVAVLGSVIGAALLITAAVGSGGVAVLAFGVIFAGAAAIVGTNARAKANVNNALAKFKAASPPQASAEVLNPA